MSKQPGSADSEQAQQPDAETGWTFAHVGALLLIGWALLVVTHTFQLVVWGDCLFDGDNGPSCQRLQARWRLANGALQAGAVLGMLLAITAMLIKSRRWRRVWLAAGYVSAIVGLVIAGA